MNQPPDTSRTKAVGIQTVNHGQILVETDLSIELPESIKAKVKVEGVLEGESATGRIDDLKAKLSDAKDLIEACCQTVQSSIANVPKPTKTSVEIGIKFSGELAVPVLAKASGEASLKVTVEW